MRVVVLMPPDGAGTNLAAIRATGVDVVGILTQNLDDLKSLAPDYVCLTGWKQIIPDEVIENYKILNIHPGLIPDTKDGHVICPDGTDGLWNKGKYKEKAIKNFLDKKATYAGSSIHRLTHEFDFGPVLARCFEKIQPDDTVDSLYTRLKIKENKLWQNVFSSLATAAENTR
ncbi:MAG: formyltransferase family protein [Patescibacteria group bacterium]